MMATAWWLGLAARAHGQGVFVRPGGISPVPVPYSPYLNLARPGNPAINYYGLVRPEFQARSTALALQSQLNQVSQQVANPAPQAATGVLPQTGYTVRFLDYGRYFNRLGNATTPIRPGFSSRIANPQRTSSSIQPPRRR
jgi:hypothetical protein